MPAVLDLWKKTTALPAGKRLFSIAFAQKAPYFATIRPRFTELRPNYATLVIPKRRGVHNHIGTVHAIALCNGLEAAMGALAEATIPRDKRWIPKGMDVSYTAKATRTSPASPRPTPSSGPRATPTCTCGCAASATDGEVVIDGRHQALGDPEAAARLGPFWRRCRPRRPSGSRGASSPRRYFFCARVASQVRTRLTTM